MKKYELIYLLSPELNETEAENTQTEIGSFITDNQGEVISARIDPARRDLGVEIGKKKSARMSSVLFILNPTHIAGLEKLLKENSKIMRHIVINKIDIKADKKGDGFRFDLEKRPSDKVELKEIDKKIEEILSE